MEKPDVKKPKTRFNPAAVDVENLMQMMRLTSLQRLQNKLRIVREENPALYHGLVRLIWSSMELKRRRAYKSV